MDHSTQEQPIVVQGEQSNSEINSQQETEALEIDNNSQNTDMGFLGKVGWYESDDSKEEIDEIEFLEDDDSLEEDIDLKKIILFDKNAEIHLTADQPICFSENGHIIGIKFIENQLVGGFQLSSLFSNAKDWQPIPKLVVLTGVNGSGKSTVLEYLYRLAQSYYYHHSKSNQILYIGPDEVLFSQDSFSSSFDTSYDISDSGRLDNLVNDCQIYLGSPGGRATFYVKQICETAKIKAKEESKVIDRRMLRELARQIICVEPLKSNDPLVRLTYVYNQYWRRVETNRTGLNAIDEISTLYKYYKKYYEKLHELAQYEKNETCTLEEFITLIENNNDFKSSLLAIAAEEISGQSPLDNVNSVLERYGFKYQLKECDKPQNRQNKKLILVAGGQKVTPNKLSSGERMIISIMSWLYYQENSDQQYLDDQDNQKIKILLLDEADRHLDPKLSKIFFEIICKEFIFNHKVQVIMSTHRFDSIAYAPKETTYIIHRKAGVQEISPVTPLEAIFKMTTNIRELTAYERKVYVESVSDALFYEGVYHTLREWLDKPNTSQSGGWYPSRRNQLSFHAVSKKNKEGKDKGDGGCKKVIDRIKTDENAIANLRKNENPNNSRWTRVRRLIDEPDMLQTFGILDYDYGATAKMIAECNVESRTIILNRYSLENFCLDPIIFCSSLTKKEINEYIKYSEIFKDNLRERKEAKKIFLDSCFKIKQNLQNKKYNDLQMYLGNYFSILLYFVADIVNKNKNPKKSETNRICREIFNKISSSLPKQEENENFCSKPIPIMSAGGMQFNVYYPEEFLNIRGHTLENKSFGKLNQVCDKIALRIYEQGIGYIPLDLYTLFQTLDLKVRRNMREAIKPKNVDKNLAFFGLPADSSESTESQEIIRSLLKKMYENKSSISSSSEFSSERNYYGLVPYNVRYNTGDCLFAAAAELAESDTDTVRQEVVNQIRNSPDLFHLIETQVEVLQDNFLRQAGDNIPFNSVEEYLEIMAQPGTWGTEIEIFALMLWLERRIVIITPGNRYDLVYGDNLYPDTRPLFLNYINNNHYQPLAIPPDGNWIDILNNIRENNMARALPESNNIVNAANARSKMSGNSISNVLGNQAKSLPFFGGNNIKQDNIKSVQVSPNHSSSDTISEEDQNEEEVSTQSFKTDPKSSGSSASNVSGKQAASPLFFDETNKKKDAEEKSSKKKGIMHRIRKILPKF